MRTCAVAGLAFQKMHQYVGSDLRDVAVETIPSRTPQQLIEPMDNSLPLLAVSKVTQKILRDAGVELVQKYGKLLLTSQLAAQWFVFYQVERI